MPSETRYEIMECEDKGGFNPAGESEWTLEAAEARQQKLCEPATEVLSKRLHVPGRDHAINRAQP